MKKIEVSDSEKRLLFLLLALILIAGAYFLVFQRYTAKAAAMEETNDADRIEVQKLESMAEREDKVRQETDELNRHIEEIIAKYPADVTTEKAIAIVKDMEESTGIRITQANFLMDNPVMNLSNYAQSAEGVPTDASSENTDGTGNTDNLENTDGANPTDGTENTDTGGSAESAEVIKDDIVGYYAALTMNYEASYDDFKKMVAYIKTFEDRMTITAAMSSYDKETGLLSGTLTVNMYYLTGTGKEYEAPQVDGGNKGVNNLFGSGRTKKQAKDSGGEE